MDINNLFWAKNFAAEAGDAVLPKFDDGQKLCFDQVVGHGRKGHGLHVNHIGRTHIVTNPAAGALSKVDIFDHSDPNVLAIVSRTS
jgi:hypothetical protein